MHLKGFLQVILIYRQIFIYTPVLSEPELDCRTLSYLQSFLNQVGISVLFMIVKIQNSPTKHNGVIRSLHM